LKIINNNNHNDNNTHNHNNHNNNNHNNNNHNNNSNNNNNNNNNNKIITINTNDTGGQIEKGQGIKRFYHMRYQQKKPHQTKQTDHNRS